MSNFLAIASVSAALRHILQESVALDVPGATVSFERPSADSIEAPTVHMIMYHATPAPNQDIDDPDARIPTDNLHRRSRAALDLHYLLCFSGRESHLESERLLGSVVRTLHERPILTRDILHRMSTDAGLPFLADSNLAQAVELVRFSPLRLSLEQLSSLWSMLFRTQYVLSVAYSAGVVSLGGGETPGRVFSAPRRRVHEIQGSAPWLERVVDADDATQPISMSSRLVAYGRALDTATAICIGEIERPLVDVTDSRLVIDLAAFAPRSDHRETPLRAGVQTLQVVAAGTGKPGALDTHEAPASNAVSFVLSPQIESVHRFPGGGPPIDSPQNDTSSEVRVSETSPKAAFATRHLEVRIRPPIAAGQQVSLSLIPQEHGVPSYRLPLTRPPKLSPHGSASILTFPVLGVVETGSYLARIRVDRADSALIADKDRNSPTFQRYVGPRVTVR